MAGLPPDVLQRVVSQALAAFGPGQNTGVLNANLIQALTSAGASPAQITALQNDQLPQGGASAGSVWGNAPGEQSQWIQQVMNAENAAPGGPDAPSAVTNAAAPPPTVAPATIASQFPGGVPQSTPYGVGAQPSVQPQQIDPNMSIAATEAYMMPQFDEQQRALTANLANAGIVGGTAPKAAADLGQQQQTTLQNNIQPFLQAGAVANQSSNLTGQIQNQNTGLAGQEFNATTQNQQQQFNIQNLLQTGQIDAATYNQMMQYVMGTQNQDWLAQLGAATSTTQNNGNNLNAAYQPVYQQPAQSNGVGNVAGAFAQSPAASPTIGGRGTIGVADPAFGANGKAA